MPGVAAACRNGWRLTTASSNGAMSSSRSCSSCSARRRSASRPACTRGCSVLTLPSRHSGNPVSSVTGVTATPVTELTGFPECLDGRVKTLHPRVHAGLLADRRRAEHDEQLRELDIAPFELAVVNLYPFRQAAATPGITPGECVEQIDIGGPAIIRAAAKNHASVAVVVDPAAYGEVLAAVAAGGYTLEQRRRLAARAFAHTAAYDVAVASWFAAGYAPDQTAADSGFPDFAAVVYTRRAVLRYGENPHQRAALYAAPDGVPGLAQARQLHGKDMSYNNYVDTDAARRAASVST